MRYKMLGILALSVVTTGAAYAGPHCAMMKQAHQGKGMYKPAVMMHYYGHPAMGGYTMKRVGDDRMRSSEKSAYGSYGKPAYTKSSPDIVDTAVSAGSFNTLVTAVQAAGLEATLRGDGPYTVFAPTDEAFAKLPDGTLEALLADPEKLKKVLTYHVVSGKVMASDLMKKQSVKTVEGSAIPSSEISVAKADIIASNGVIHVVDEVLIPKQM